MWKMCIRDRDFDDAISITATPSGWTLAVHIADVSHFVRPGGRTDMIFFIMRSSFLSVFSVFFSGELFS